MIKIKFEFPDTGEGVTEGQFLEWKVEEGDEVEEDQVVGEAETDKAVVDIPSPVKGTVEELKASPGDKVEVGDVIMILDGESEKTQEDTQKAEEDSTDDGKNNTSDKEDAVMGGSPSASSYDDENKDTTKRSSKNNDVLALPKVRKLAEEKGVNLSELDVGGRISEEEVLKASDSEELKDEDQQNNIQTEDKEEQESSGPQNMEDVTARPSVKKLAREHDIEISMIEGSGRNGEVTREDILTAAGEIETKERKEDRKINEQKVEKPQIEHEGSVERIEMSETRKVTASRMAKSKNEAAHVTHIEKADITKLVELRESLKNDVDAHLTYLPFIMKACVAGLKQHPKLNSELDEEHNEIIKKKFYDFNIAVDTDRGLLAPKIEQVDDKSMVDLAQQIADKASKAQEGDLDREEMKSGTFSITNLGVIGGEAFTPIIYPPQSAILGIGKIQETAEVVEGEVVPRKTVKLSLSYDHRVIDGAEAARFMQKVVEDLENPRNLIVDM